MSDPILTASLILGSAILLLAVAAIGDTLRRRRARRLRELERTLGAGPQQAHPPHTFHLKEEA